MLIKIQGGKQDADGGLSTTTGYTCQLLDNGFIAFQSGHGIITMLLSHAKGDSHVIDEELVHN
jgi:hypothetical protein